MIVHSMCGRRLALSVVYLAVTTPGRGGYSSEYTIQWSHTLAPWGWGGLMFFSLVDLCVFYDDSICSG
jgi:hypothetical protein